VVVASTPESVGPSSPESIAPVKPGEPASSLLGASGAPASESSPALGGCTGKGESGATGEPASSTPGAPCPLASRPHAATHVANATAERRRTYTPEASARVRPAGQAAESAGIGGNSRATECAWGLGDPCGGRGSDRARQPASAPKPRERDLEPFEALGAERVLATFEGRRCDRAGRSDTWRSIAVGRRDLDLEEGTLALDMARADAPEAGTRVHAKAWGSAQAGVEIAEECVPLGESGAVLTWLWHG
jgi:hypothetical protein